MANAIFFQNNRIISDFVTSNIDYSLIMRLENHVVLQNILDNLTIHILDDWKTKVTYASNRGFKFTPIYRYFRTDKFGGYPVDLLINGPNLDYQFFIQNGYNSVLDQLKVALAPGKVTNNFFLQNKGSFICLNWI
jgi:hypothetical protein